MSFRNLVGLAAIGGLLYAHKKHGGELTLASFKQSWNDLLDNAKMRAMNARSAAENKLHEAAEKVADATEVRTPGEMPSSSGYGGGNYRR